MIVLLFRSYIYSFSLYGKTYLEIRKTNSTVIKHKIINNKNNNKLKILVFLNIIIKIVNSTIKITKQQTYILLKLTFKKRNVNTLKMDIITRGIRPSKYETIFIK